MDEIESFKQKWCQTRKKINDTQCVTCRNNAVGYEASLPFYQFCGAGCQELFHGLWFQFGTKRLRDPDVVSPHGWDRLAEVQPELLVFILEFRYPQWQTDKKQFEELAQIRMVDENIKEIIDERMYKKAITIPSGIEDALTNDLLKRLPNLESLNISAYKPRDDKEYLDLTHLSRLVDFLPPDHNHFILGNLANLEYLNLKKRKRVNMGTILTNQLASLSHIKRLNLIRSDIIDDEHLASYTNLEV
jgi:hypothetical protein